MLVFLVVVPVAALLEPYKLAEVMLPMVWTRVKVKDRIELQTVPGQGQPPPLLREKPQVRMRMVSGRKGGLEKLQEVLAR